MAPRVRNGRFVATRVLLMVAAIVVTTIGLGAQPTAPPAGGQGGQGGQGLQGAAPAVPAGRGGPALPATEPRPRDDARHQSFLDVARGGNIDVLFVGDSITDWWRSAGRGQRIWEQNFGSRKAANFGIAGDTTQGVLWRMQNGELEGFKARLIILMLGTNNINRNPNDEIAEGDRLIIAEFKKRQPQAKVLVLGIFPRGVEANTPMRASIKAINERLATFADNRQVFYLDIGKVFLAEDGVLPPDIMPDALHPSERGYQLWADAMLGKVNELLK